MKKTYTKQQIFDFCDAYKLAMDSGLVAEITPQSKFFDKFLNSLYALGTLVRSDRQSEWNRQKTTAFHTWLGYDGDNFFLATRRDDDWSNALVDDCLEYYQLDAVNEWVSFTKSEEYNDNVRVVSEYYERTGGYFKNYISAVKSGRLLDQNSYNRFVNNKYAEKVLSAHKAEPRFSVGSLADFRTNATCTSDRDGILSVYKRSPNGIMILSNSEPIVSACVGAKRYKAVCIGDTKPFWIEERYLKGRKKRK